MMDAEYLKRRAAFYNSMEQIEDIPGNAHPSVMFDEFEKWLKQEGYEIRRIK
jgi:hypothetical protein